MAGIGGAAGGVAAAAIAIQRKKILKTFRQFGAVSVETARSSQDLAVRRSLLFRRMVRTGVVVDCGDDHYYLDEVAEARERQRRLRFARWLVAAMTLAFVVVLVLETM
ncbi:MAG: hypothetical protein AAF657_17735 [Acidobacteriota bacterium]